MTPSPNSRSSGSGEFIPFGESNRVDVIHIVGRPPAEPGEELGAEGTAVSPSYFSAMQIPLLQGRVFTSADGPDSQKVVLINETLVRQQFPNGDPLGHQLDIGEAHDICTIVGVVHDLKINQFAERPRRQIYLPESQFPSAHLAIVARPAPGSSSDIPAAIRSAVWSVDADQPILPVRSLQDIIVESTTGQRILAQLLGFFAALALLLGSIGIYGVMAHSVQQRIHGIGVRMALGASARDVIRMIVAQGLKLTLAGVAVGIILAFATARATASVSHHRKIQRPGNLHRRPNLLHRRSPRRLLPPCPSRRPHRPHARPKVRVTQHVGSKAYRSRCRSQCGCGCGCGCCSVGVGVGVAVWVWVLQCWCGCCNVAVGVGGSVFVCAVVFLVLVVLVVLVALFQFKLSSRAQRGTCFKRRGISARNSQTIRFS